MKINFYAVDYDVHPQYEAYWVVRFNSRKKRDNWVEGFFHREALVSSHKAIKYAKKHNTFYDTDKFVPQKLF